MGELSYLAGVTRPDLQYVVSSLQSFANNPGEQHWRVVTQVVKVHTYYERYESEIHGKIRT